eukprot:7839812-Pyramimonas_sp.AAC.1
MHVYDPLKHVYDPLKHVYDPLKHAYDPLKHVNDPLSVSRQRTSRTSLVNETLMHWEPGVNFASPARPSRPLRWG